MVHVDVPKVKGKMAERGYTITSMAKSLKISRSTLSAYMELPEKIPYSVISRMAEILCDSTDEASSIFLLHAYVLRKFFELRKTVLRKRLSDNVKEEK